MNPMNRYAGIATLMLAATGCGGPEELESMEQLESQAQVETGTELTGEVEDALTAASLGKIVTLQVKASGLCLDVGRIPSGEGAPIRQYPCHGGDNQKFRLISEGNDFYRVVNVYSGLCLDIKDASDASGARLQQYRCHGGGNQQFRFNADGGYYQMKVRDSGKCVEAEQTYPLPEARVQQATCRDTPEQRFKVKAQ
jgi:hypothetical protein